MSGGTRHISTYAERRESSRLLSKHPHSIAHPESNFGAVLIPLYGGDGTNVLHKSVFPILRNKASVIHHAGGEPKASHPLNDPQQEVNGLRTRKPR